MDAIYTHIAAGLSLPPLYIFVPRALLNDLRIFDRGPRNSRLVIFTQIDRT